MIEENAKGLVERLGEIDWMSRQLSSTFSGISAQHKQGGGHIEFAYLQHFLDESLDVSYLFQHLFRDSNTRSFLGIGNRMMFELMLKTEYVIRLKNEGDDNKILSLLSKDMASTMSALDEAVGSSEDNPIKDTLVQMDVVNKILKTDFDLKKIKPNTPIFPKVKDLCEKSNLCIKDYCGNKLWHNYVSWSWNNHSRLGNKATMESRSGEVVNNEVECFIEMYSKVIKLLAIHANDSEVERGITNLMTEIGILHL